MASFKRGIFGKQVHRFHHLPMTRLAYAEFKARDTLYSAAVPEEPEPIEYPRRAIRRVFFPAYKGNGPYSTRVSWIADSSDDESMPSVRQSFGKKKGKGKKKAKSKASPKPQPPEESTPKSAVEVATPADPENAGSQEKIPEEKEPTEEDTKEKTQPEKPSKTATGVKNPSKKTKSPKPALKAVKKEVPASASSSASKTKGVSFTADVATKKEEWAFGKEDMLTAAGMPDGILSDLLTQAGTLPWKRSNRASCHYVHRLILEGAVSVLNKSSTSSLSTRKKNSNSCHLGTRGQR